MRTDTIARPDDLDAALDYTISEDGRVLGYMRADFRQASAQVLVAADGEWRPTGRQVADFGHSSEAAAVDLFGDLAMDPDALDVL